MARHGIVQTFVGPKTKGLLAHLRLRRSDNHSVLFLQFAVSSKMKQGGQQLSPREITRRPEDDEEMRLNRWFSHDFLFRQSSLDGTIVRQMRSTHQTPERSKPLVTIGVMRYDLPRSSQVRDRTSAFRWPEQQDSRSNLQQGHMDHSLARAV